MISEGCIVNGTVTNSILSGGVVIEDGAEVKDSVIMDDVVIKRGAKVYTSIVDSDTVIYENAVVGVENAAKSEITVIAKGSEIKPENK